MPEHNMYMYSATSDDLSSLIPFPTPFDENFYVVIYQIHSPELSKYKFVLQSKGKKCPTYLNCIPMNFAYKINNEWFFKDS